MMRDFPRVAVVFVRRRETCHSLRLALYDQQLFCRRTLISGRQALMSGRKASNPSWEASNSVTKASAGRTTLPWGRLRWFGVVAAAPGGPGPHGLSDQGEQARRRCRSGHHLVIPRATAGAGAAGWECGQRSHDHERKDPRHADPLPLQRERDGQEEQGTFQQKEHEPGRVAISPPRTTFFSAFLLLPHPLPYRVRAQDRLLIAAH